MAKFRSPKSLQKFVSIHLSLHNYFNLERHLYNRQTFKLIRTVALGEWRQLAPKASPVLSFADQSALV